MGSSFHPGYSSDGVIPRAMDAIFGRVARSQDTALTIRVGFVEIHRVRWALTPLGRKLPARRAALLEQPAQRIAGGSTSWGLLACQTLSRRAPLSGHALREAFL